jgi:hypothetical protein
MTYIENPKTKGSGILTAIPQLGRCPNECDDCFFQTNDRSYLAPLSEHLPNMPTPEQSRGYVIRVNDGNDSNVQRDLVISSTDCYEDRFFNTAIPRALDTFPGPVVLTVNPGKFTDNTFYSLDPIPLNLTWVSEPLTTIRAAASFVSSLSWLITRLNQSRELTVSITYSANVRSIPISPLRPMSGARS